jgi:hypothetical protein
VISVKTRIIQTRFWDDEFICECDIYTQHLFIYLLTSQYINISGIFQLSPKKIQFEAKLTENQFEQAKDNLERAGKVFFHEGWVYVVNARKNNNYLTKELNQKAYQKEIERVPATTLSLLTDYQRTTDGVHLIHKQETINNKPKTINQKQETKNHKEEVYKSVIEHFNQTFQRKVSSFVAWKDNCNFWLENYTLQQIKDAMSEWKRGGWIWKSKDGKDYIPSLETLFRTQNAQGKCDYIGQLLERSVLNSPETRRSLDPLAEAARRRANQ